MLQCGPLGCINAIQQTFYFTATSDPYAQAAAKYVPARVNYNKCSMDACSVVAGVNSNCSIVAARATAGKSGCIPVIPVRSGPKKPTHCSHLMAKRNPYSNWHPSRELAGWDVDPPCAVLSLSLWSNYGHGAAQVGAALPPL